MQVVLFRSSDIPISVDNMVWTGEHRGFAVRAYFENNQSVIATQRAFRRRFNIPRNNAVPQRIIEEVNAIPRDMCERAVRNFRERLQQCVAANGRHLADIIFRT